MIAVALAATSKSKIYIRNSIVRFCSPRAAVCRVINRPLPNNEKAGQDWQRLVLYGYFLVGKRWSLYSSSDLEMATKVMKIAARAEVRGYFSTCH